MKYLESRLFEKNKRFINFVSIYWLILPVLFLSFLGLKAGMEGTPIKDMLTLNPTLAIMLLIALISPVASLYLLKLPQEDKTRTGSGGKFLIFSIVQQAAVGNFLGVGLSFLAYREMIVGKKSDKSANTAFLSIVVFQLFFTLIALFAFYMLNKNKL